MSWTKKIDFGVLKFRNETDSKTREAKAKSAKAKRRGACGVIATDVSQRRKEKALL
jgi:hypothetical protein